MYRVDISADLNDDDGSGYLWTFLDEARDPARISRGVRLLDTGTAAARVVSQRVVSQFEI